MGCNRGSIALLSQLSHIISIIASLLEIRLNDTKPMFIDWSVWSPEFFAPILESTSKSPKFPEKYFYRESSTVAVIAPRTC